MAREDSGRKAAVGRRVKNKLRPQPPREYVCLIGGPSNTFNGYYGGVSFTGGANPYEVRLNAMRPAERELFLPDGAHDPEHFFMGRPAPRNLREISYYIGKDNPRTTTWETVADQLYLRRTDGTARAMSPGEEVKGQVVYRLDGERLEALKKATYRQDAAEGGQKLSWLDFEKVGMDRWGEHGWSDGAVMQMQDRGWKIRDVSAATYATHDRYWANFVDPAARLYRDHHPWDAPLRRPKPRPGDIVTFLVFHPGYALRQCIDWEASPHNPFRHGDKMEQDAKGGRYRKSDTPQRGTGAASRERAREAAERAAERRRFQQEYQYKRLSEDDLNYYIGLRTIGENKRDLLKRPTKSNDYYEYIERILLSNVRHEGVLVKVMFFTSPLEVARYLSEGRWEPGIDNEYYGKLELLADYVRFGPKVYGSSQWRRQSVIARPTYDEKHCGFVPRPPGREYNDPPWWYHALPSYVYRKDTWRAEWDASPHVDRAAVKVCRFDYFGHAGNWSMMLQWGWKNRKGESPGPDDHPVTGKDQSLDWEVFENHISHDAFTKDAFAMLWGCNLGASEDDGRGLGPWLANKGYFQSVVAAVSQTTFAHITAKPNSMPEPTDGKWHEYPPY